MINDLCAKTFSTTKINFFLFNRKVFYKDENSKICVTLVTNKGSLTYIFYITPLGIIDI